MRRHGIGLAAAILTLWGIGSFIYVVEDYGVARPPYWILESFAGCGLLGAAVVLWRRWNRTFGDS
jgi:hypothetical protein